MSKLVQKIPKIIEATSSWSLDLLDLSCVDRTTTTSLLPTIYYNLLLFCCLRWWIRDNSLKNKHGFSFRTFFSLLSFKQACRSLLSLNLSTAATKCYMCRSAHIRGSHWWYWLKRVQVKLVAFNHRNFDWKFVCCLLLYWSHLLSSFQRWRCVFGKLEIESFVHFVVYLNNFFDGTTIITAVYRYLVLITLYFTFFA